MRLSVLRVERVTGCFLVEERNKKVIYCHQPITALFWGRNDCWESSFWDLTDRIEESELLQWVCPGCDHQLILSRVCWCIGFLVYNMILLSIIYKALVIPEAYFKSIVTLRILQSKIVYSSREAKELQSHSFHYNVDVNIMPNTPINWKPCF